MDESEKRLSAREKAAAMWKTGYAQNIGSRKEQQDSFGFAGDVIKDSPVLLAVLADGMGGMNDGAKYSRITVDSHRDNLRKALELSKSLPDVLLNLAVIANKDVQPVRNPDKPGGTTLISALFFRNVCAFLSIGDSRICLVRDGKILQLNREHTLGALLDEKACLGLIDKEDAENNTYRDALSSSIGDERIKKVDVIDRPFKLLHGDRIVLMSDGVYRTIPNAALVKKMELEPQKAVDEIVKYILNAAKPDQDNFSIIVVEYR